jgi:uncharacterized protein with ParB-like and HNH nuclease domain
VVGNPLKAEQKMAEDSWFEGDDSVIQDSSFKDYQITATPNDFNIKTIVDFVESGVVKIPGFQRNYVWDIERASRLIESLLMGLPIPQIFLYEQARNSFLVIDGQQRLMSIYYFVNRRFPRKDKRVQLRQIFAENGKIPREVFADDKFFRTFNLQLPEQTGKGASRFHEKNYETLSDFKTTLDLTVIRNIIIRQSNPVEDRDSSIFEIFNRLNTGGVNLTAQEIRASIYQSDFMNMLDRMTFNPVWRKFIHRPEPDINLKETEILLRSFAMLAEGVDYREPMGLFLNSFAKKAVTFSDDEVTYAENLMAGFFGSLQDYPREIFSVTSRTRFNISIFEATFRLICEASFKSKRLKIKAPSVAAFNKLRTDAQFVEASRFATGQATNVRMRYQRAKSILK